MQVLESAGDFLSVSDILDRIREDDLKDVMSRLANLIVLVFFWLLL